MEIAIQKEIADQGIMTSIKSSSSRRKICASQKTLFIQLLDINHSNLIPNDCFTTYPIINSINAVAMP